MRSLDAYNELGRLGLIAGSSGNVSERGNRGMIITPSGGSPGGVDDAAMARMTFDGTVMNKVTPSSEWAMHAAIYRAFPAANVVVHMHSDACTALASLNERLPPFHYMVVRFGGADVRCAPYLTFGTPDLAAAAIAAMKDRTACLLANHGAILYAADETRAVAQAVLLESLCRQFLMARAAGAPRLLSDEEIAGAIERFKTYGPAQNG